MSISILSIVVVGIVYIAINLRTGHSSASTKGGIVYKPEYDIELEL